MSAGGGQVLGNGRCAGGSGLVKAWDSRVLMSGGEEGRVEVVVRLVRLDKYQFFYLFAIAVWLASGLGAFLGLWSIHWAAFVSACAGIPNVILQRKLYKDEEADG
ncbi:hypothetical protein O7632_08205 [Solwaraspora sp. WMMD406]|uniref:hypothetical protein n=1 Tax=Solwaraspora sp. WMMD406 TaxID=3016095 RepID=UPI00241618CA|nr:hypothetical protein [Solwaraspora sp. WMMD406]MDG4764087.1 hypothetical protein [Solwaraspora sp. WMMD406]